MRILVLNGSPKKEKSDTLHITRAFLDGMNEVQANEVTLLHTVEKQVGACLGCFSCMRGDGTCVLHDDMDEILPLILESDLLIFSFPLYYYAMPANLKAVLDRTLPLGKMTMKKAGDRYEHETQADYSHMRFLMISGCGFPNARHNFEAAETQFRLTFGEQGTILTVPETPMFSAPEAEPVTTPFLALVRRAGHEYAAQGDISRDTRKKLSVPMIPEEEYARIVNGEP